MMSDWSVVEVERLHKYFQEEKPLPSELPMVIREMASVLGKPEREVYGMIVRHGLHYQQPQRGRGHGLQYTDYEDSVIMNYYPMGGSGACQQFIYRKSDSIYRRAKMLGVRWLGQPYRNEELGFNLHPPLPTGSKGVIRGGHRVRFEFMDLLRLDSHDFREKYNINGAEYDVLIRKVKDGDCVYLRRDEEWEE